MSAGEFRNRDHTSFSTGDAFRALLCFAEMVCERRAFKFNNYNFPNVFLKESFDFLFDKGITVPGITREKMNDYFHVMDYMAKPLLFLGISSYEAMGFNEKKFRELYEDLKYCNHNYITIHLLIQYLITSDQFRNWNPGKAYEYMRSKYEKNREFVIRNTGSPYIIQNYSGTLDEKIAGFEPIFRNGGNDLNKFYNWAFKFISNNYPVFWTGQKLIPDLEEIQVMNTLIGNTRNPGERVSITGKIIGFREPAKTDNSFSNSFLVEIFSKDREFFTFLLKYKSLEQKTVYANSIYLGMDGVSISGNVKRAIEKHWIWNSPVYSLKGVRTVMFPR